ncbi:TetR family transcriptional regulator [uncultured Jatrophihabitans sp.]|uniref:TetR family transcriptional regulator n=1 Tax=uncultured Jatrophihabitans sp. TaxID=1610747 RepID=UPI0035C95969
MPGRGPVAGEPVRYATAARGLLRDTIVDSVDALARSRGWAATTMSDVARTAGVSRQTLYNEFGSRHALVEAYVAREIERLVAAASEAVRHHADDAKTALREAFALFLRLASDEPVVKIIVADTSTEGELLQLLTGVGQAVAGGRIATLIQEVWPQVGPADAQVVAETLVRLAISHALLPVADPDVVAGDVSRLLAPFVDSVLGP